MVPGVVKESSGLFTVTSTLYLKPDKIDAKSVFHCTVEYRMPKEEIKKENSEPFNLTLLCKLRAFSQKSREALHGHVLHTHSVLLPSDPAENVFFKLLNTAPIKEGDDVQMQCETDGNPQPQFEFTKDVRGLFSACSYFHMTSLFIVAHSLSLSHAGLYGAD